MTLTGKAAEAFIAKSFPNAYIPGDVSGAFHYDRDGRKGVGHAKCSVPAMGARGRRRGVDVHGPVLSLEDR